ncbi:MAG: putative sulfate exporter family transporter [Calditrichaeota bacterium]|nr:putative sulfate exporter family transporter [Calditrichota bacterium]HQU73548.1 putative sulfate exporter family transporter [Calditrichia bacterium]
MIPWLKHHLPGLLLVVAIALLAREAAALLKAEWHIEALTVAILLGMLLSNVARLPARTLPGIRYSLKTVLKAGIVLFGLRLNLEAVLALGPRVLLLVIFYVALTLVLAYLFGRLLKMNSKLAVLIGVGTGICGASAVVAMAPCIHAEEDDAIIAVSVVSFLGAVGVLIYSALATSGLEISATSFGIWSGLSLHGVAHALAAAFAMGEKAGEIGTFVKMSRVVMLVPVSLVLAYLFRDGSRGPTRTAFPVYVLGFVGLGLLNTFFPLPPWLLQPLKWLGSFFILMAMTAMGLSVNFKSIAGKGGPAFLQGIIIFAILSMLSFAAVKVFID